MPPPDRGLRQAVDFTPPVVRFGCPVRGEIETAADEVHEPFLLQGEGLRLKLLLLLR